MKKLLTIIIAAICISAPLRETRALDFSATPQTAWAAYVGTPAPAHITDARLRSAMEWRVLGGPMPRISATPYGIRLSLWDRTIKNFGLPVVAAEYQDFLKELRAELDRESPTKTGAQ